MKAKVPFKTLLLALLLALSNLTFASHVSAHLDLSPKACDWCVCQGQTPAVPLAAEPSIVLLQSIHLAPPAPQALPVALTPSQSYQSRAPPTSA